MPTTIHHSWMPSSSQQWMETSARQCTSFMGQAWTSGSRRSMKVPRSRPHPTWCTDTDLSVALDTSVQTPWLLWCSLCSSDFAMDLACYDGLHLIVTGDCSTGHGRVGNTEVALLPRLRRLLEQVPAVKQLRGGGMLRLKVAPSSVPQLRRRRQHREHSGQEPVWR